MVDGPGPGEVLREPERLGSLVDWAEARGMDPRSSDTLSAYTTAMGEHTQQRADWLGVSVEKITGAPNKETVEDMEAAARARDQRIAA